MMFGFYIESARNFMPSRERKFWPVDQYFIIPSPLRTIEPRVYKIFSVRRDGDPAWKGK